ncbi:hypothetical protein BHU16_01220 [Tannerella sp. oral taxon 808]|nr:hypothetical protein BHU16_01220 [Tannerella sp. oral taxon 808]
MGKMLEELKNYFDNTPQEVLDKEWEELAYLNKIGPDVFEYAEAMKEYIEFLRSEPPTLIYNREQNQAYSFEQSNEVEVHNENDYDYAA